MSTKVRKGRQLMGLWVIDNPEDILEAILVNRDDRVGDEGNNRTRRVPVGTLGVASTL
jgi:hypothetical protein